MLFEVVLYVKHRMTGRVSVEDGEIISVVENGVKREPKSKSFKAAIRHLMDNTDVEPVGQPQVIGRKSYFTTYKHTYRKPNVYINSQHDRWACAYPVDDHWMVRKAGKDVETRFENRNLAMVDVDTWAGYDFVKDLHRMTVDKNHKPQRGE